MLMEMTGRLTENWLEACEPTVGQKPAASAGSVGRTRHYSAMTQVLKG